MDSWLQRTEALVGQKGIEKLKNTKVAIFGVGGVGSFVTESLARVGVGNIILIDKDCVDITNINRQIHALHSTIGQSKVELMKKRVKDINPEINVKIHETFFLGVEQGDIIDDDCSYIVDAIDTVTGKLAIVELGQGKGIPVISSMGTGNKLNPTMLEVDDIYNTSVCPLAKVMRKELKQRGVESLKVVYSKEKPLINRRPPASVSFIPSVAGLIIASEVIKDVLSM